MVLALALTPGAAAQDTAYFPDSYEPTYNFSGEEPEWTTEVSSTWLGWGDTKSVGNSVVGNYTVEPYEFEVDPDTREVTGALVKVHDASGVEVASGFIDGRTSPYINYRDEVRVKIEGVRDAGGGGSEWGDEVKPQAKVTVQRRELPEPATSSPTVYDSHDLETTVNRSFSSSTVWASATFENTGDATLYDARFTLDVANLTVQEVHDAEGRLGPSLYTVENGTLAVDYSDVEPRVENASDWLAPGETYTLDVKLRTPSLLEERTFNLTSRVAGVDLKMNRFEDTAGPTPFTVYSTVYVEKDLRPDMNKETEGREMYLGKEFTVIITIKNFADAPVTVHRIADTVPDVFALAPNATTEWTDREVPPGDNIVLTYKVIARNTGEVDIPDPVTNFTWKGENVDPSTAVAVDTIVVEKGSVHGPVLTVTKSVSPSSLDIGDEGEVSIEVKNTGDRAARIDLREESPEELLPLDTVPQLNTVLKGGDSLSTGYRFRAMEGGNVTLSPTRITYRDVFGNSWKTASDEANVSIAGDATPTPAPTETVEDGEDEGSPPLNASTNTSGNASTNSTDDGLLPDLPIPDLPLPDVGGMIGGLAESIRGLIPI